METNGKSDKNKRDLEEIVKQAVSKMVNSGMIQAKDMDAHLFKEVAQLNIEKKDLKDTIYSLQKQIKEYERQGDPYKNNEILEAKESIKRLGEDVMKTASEIAKKAEAKQKEYETKMANIDKTYIVREAELDKKMSDIKEKYETEKLELKVKISSLETEVELKEKENILSLQGIRKEIANRNSEHANEVKELKSKYETEIANKNNEHTNEVRELKNSYDTDKILLDLSHAEEIGNLIKKSENERKSLLRMMIESEIELSNIKDEHKNFKEQKKKEIEDLTENYLCLEDREFVLKKMADAYQNKVLEEKVLGNKNQEENQYEEKMFSQIEELGKNLDKFGKSFKKLNQKVDGIAESVKTCGKTEYKSVNDWLKNRKKGDNEYTATMNNGNKVTIKILQ